MALTTVLRTNVLHCDKVVQCEISHISHNYFRRRPKFFCSADFRLAAFFPADFRPAIIFRRIRLKFGGWGSMKGQCDQRQTENAVERRVDGTNPERRRRLCRCRVKRSSTFRSSSSNSERSTPCMKLSRLTYLSRRDGANLPWTAAT